MANKTLLEIVEDHTASVEDLERQVIEMGANVEAVLNELNRLRLENDQLKAEKICLQLHADNLRYMIRMMTQREMEPTIQ